VSRLFVSLYFDEDVSVLIAKLIASRGFSTLTTRHAGQRRASDAEQLAFAVQREMAIVSHNRIDFERLARHYIDEGRRHSGIIIAVRRPPYDIARRLLLLLNRVAADEMVDQLLYV